MQKTRYFALFALALAFAACDKAELSTVAGPDVLHSEQDDAGVDPVTGSQHVVNGSKPMVGDLTIGRDISTGPAAFAFSPMSGMTFTDLEDLTHSGSGYHTMSAHNPYFGMSFTTNTYHWAESSYGTAHSGVVRLFNAFGVDAETITFPAGIYFFSAWIGEPHHSPKQVWLEAYNGSVLVATSTPIVASFSTPQLVQMAFNTPVTSIRIRRQHGWWIMDDLCYATSPGYNAGACAAAPVNAPPTANAGADQTVNLNGSTTTAVQLNGSASTDDGAPQPLTYDWKENGVTIASGATPTVTLGLGTHTITLTVNDGEESASDDVVITVVDPTPPVITPSVAGTLGSLGWYVSDVTVSFAVSDLESAVQATGCDGASVTSDTNGASFTCSASSAGGNSSQTVTVKRDATNPVVGFSGNAGTYNVDQQITITCSATDAMSGIATATCPQVSAAAHTFSLGSHTLSAAATDNAGNNGSAQTSFTVQATYASVCALVRLWVTQHGIANSLCVKLNAAAAAASRGNSNAAANQLDAFINEVNAQSGRAVPAARTLQLIGYANALK